MKIRTLSKQDVEKEPYLVWNALVDLLAIESYEDLSEEQRATHLSSGTKARYKTAVTFNISRIERDCT